jgi:acetate kinase
MDWCGLSLDQAKNGTAIGTEAIISSPAVRVRACVIPSDEEAIIARETARLFQRKRG